MGISGVGKTQILNSILNLKNIAKGGSSNEIEWKISFSNDNKEYLWEGQFETIDQLADPFLALFLDKQEELINTFNSVTENSYYIFSGRGIPLIYRHAIESSIRIK